MGDEELTKTMYKEVEKILDTKFSELKVWMEEKFVTKDRFFSRLMVIGFFIVTAMVLGGYGAGLRFIEVLALMKGH